MASNTQNPGNIKCPFNKARNCPIFIRCSYCHLLGHNIEACLKIHCPLCRDSSHRKESCHSRKTWVKKGFMKQNTDNNPIKDSASLTLPDLEVSALDTTNRRSSSASPPVPPNPPRALQWRTSMFVHIHSSPPTPPSMTGRKIVSRGACWWSANPRCRMRNALS